MSANPFARSDVARRYDAGRPYFHPLVIHRIKNRAGLQKVKNALDVGCGTGLSSKALLELASRVEALDASKEMLESAFQDPRISYRAMRAEDIDYADETFDVITASQVVHWTDQKNFFAKAKRCLKRNGLLVVYDNFFLWRSTGVEALATWLKEKYRVKFPPPARAEIALSADGTMVPDGFSFAGYEEYDSPIAYRLEELIKYLITQSNVCSACDAKFPLETAMDWLRKELAPFFSRSESLTFHFGGPIYYLRRIDN